jgi:hypothetical protein
MKKIHLGGKYGSIIGNYALVDDEDYEWLNQWKWYGWKHRNTIYARRGDYSTGKLVTIIMHRVILGLTDPKISCDHINRNGLNNQRTNLRSCSPGENRMNQGLSSNNISGVTGVSWCKAYKKYVANIQVCKKPVFIGYFARFEDAKKARRAAELKHFGHFARLDE